MVSILPIAVCSLLFCLFASASDRQAPATLPSQSIPPGRLPNNLDLLQTSIEELGLFLSNNSGLTSVKLVQTYLANIKKNNHQGLNLRAIIQTPPLESVLAIAAELDAERTGGQVRGALHGIPIIVKDSIATAVELGMDTSAGSFALKASKVKKDAEVIRKLREAGAIIIGKANLAEFSGGKAYMRDDRPELGDGYIEGWSAVGGQTSSAYVEGGFEAGGDPLGSSSGSAVGVSAGFAAASLGGDTTGSIISPASRAALFSIRPSTGLVSTNGVVPLSGDLDTLGPIGFTTRDVAMLLDAMTYDDGRYLKAARPTTMSTLRLGLVTKNFLDKADGRAVDPQTCVEETEETLRATMDLLEREGADVSKLSMKLNFSDITEIDRAVVGLWLSGYKADMGTYLADLEESPVRTLEDLVDWNDAHSDIEFPPGHCCQQTLVRALISPDRKSTEYNQARNTINALARDRGLKYLYDQSGVDALVFSPELGHPMNLASALGYPAYLFDQSGVDALVFSPELGHPMNLVSALGYPAGTAPMGYCENGAASGILFVVKAGEEEKLLGILSAYEAIMPKRKVPALLRTKT